MERFRYDRSSKWLIEHHGDSILRLAGVDDVIAWKPLPAEVVQPRQLPDGLLEVQRRGRSGMDLYLIEIETYADRQIDAQIMDDLMLIYQTRRLMPETVLLVLRPKGQVQAPSECEVASASGQTRMAGRWPVVELWKLPAEAMLALRDPGLIPWITLMESALPPAQLLKECREVIDERATPAELANVLAVSQILASLRYNEQWLFNFFGGKEAMIDSPYLNRFVEEQVNLRLDKKVAELVDTKVAQIVDTKVAKQRHVDILRMLKFRFGPAPADMVAAFEKVTAESELDRLADWAETCLDLESFQKQLPA
jgi:hypothetical protein